MKMEFSFVLQTRQNADVFITLDENIHGIHSKRANILYVGEKYLMLLPALVAQLDARLTGDQEVAGSTSARSATFFHGDWSWNAFYGHSLPSADSRSPVVSFWRKNVHNTG